MSIHTKTVAELSKGLATGEYTSVALTQAFLERIKANSDLNAFITVTEEQALSQAKVADERIKAGTSTPLTGIPFAHKDIFCTEGVKTSCGSKMLDNFISPYNATVVEKMNDAGMVMLGKLNLDEFAMGGSNENSFYGAVKNPWNTDCVPGGSSGGSAAAVAARMVPAATGTDTGGSIRQPASFCGVTGLKPTYGTVSRYGMIAFASSLDQGGAIAQTAEDCGLLLQVMAGFDERDSTSVERDVPDYNAELNKPLDGLKIGLPKEFFGEGLNADVNTVIQNAVNTYRELGAEIIDISLPNTHLAVPAYYVVAPAECSSNLSRMDGVRFGHRCENPTDLDDLYCRSRSEGFGEEVKRRILVGTYALSTGYYDAYYLKAQKIRQLIAQDYQHAFEQVDVILGPTAPDVAYEIGTQSNDPVAMYLADIYTIGVNLAGLPALSHPAGLACDLPVGVQLIGNHFAEQKLLNVAHQFQQKTDWHTQQPSAVSNVAGE